jgi:hypothetical protein
VQDGFEPGFFLIRMGVGPSAALTITVGSHTWVATDEFDYGEFLPFLMFDADDELLGARFFGENSAGEVFGTFVFAFLVNGFPPGLFAASSEMILGPVEGVGVTGEFEVPGWDGDIPVLAPVVPRTRYARAARPRPARSQPDETQSELSVTLDAAESPATRRAFCLCANAADIRVA